MGACHDSAMSPACQTPASERLQTALHLLLHAAGYAPLKTWCAEEFVFVTFGAEEKARDALTTFRRVRWVREAYLRHEGDGTPYIIVRH